MSESERSEQLDQLLHAINHDLRTPLGNIRSAISILLQDLSDPLTKDQRTFIEIIERSTVRLLDQSNRLLLFSQIAFTTADLEPTQLSEVLGNTKRNLKNSYEIDTVTLETDGDPLIICNEYILSATLALLAAGDTKHEPDPLTDQPPAILTQTQAETVWFTIHSKMPIHILAHSLVELTGEIVQLHGSKLETSELDGKKQFKFGLPLAKNNA